jgi:hypothetical protein
MRRRLAVVVVLVLVLGGGYFGYRHFHGSSSGPTASLAPCPVTMPTIPPAAQERVVVRNATLRTGLASDVARELRQRHFKIGAVGNTLFQGKGVATVKYSGDRATSAELLAAQFDGATLDEVSGSHVLEIDIGPRFHSLVPLAQAQADEGALTTPTPTPSATVTPQCAPQSPTATP